VQRQTALHPDGKKEKKTFVWRARKLKKLLRTEFSTLIWAVLVMNAIAMILHARPHLALKTFLFA